MRISISKSIPAIIELVLKLLNCHVFQIPKYQGAAIYHKQGVYSTGKQKICLLKIHKYGPALRIALRLTFAEL